MRFDKSSALCSLRPRASFAVVNGEIQWFDNIQTQPTQSEIEAEIVRLQAEYEAKQYQRDRASEYPALADQLDMLYHDRINSTDTWMEAIQAVKNKYPKS